MTVIKLTSGLIILFAKKEELGWILSWTIRATTETFYQKF